MYFPPILFSYGLNSGSHFRQDVGRQLGVERCMSEFEPQTLLGDVACITDSTVPIRHFSPLERLDFNLKHPFCP